MSAIKYQLRQLLPSLSHEAKQLRDPNARARLYLIKAIAESTKPIAYICERRSFSTNSFYIWARRLLKAKSVNALFDRSRRPKDSPSETPKQTIRKIVKLRKAEPYLGPDRISDDLRRLYRVHCPRDTVAAILKREGLITKETKKSLTKKHIKRYRRPFPGYLQMDFKYVPYLIGSKQYYQLSCVDHHSSWRLIRCYTHKNEEAVMSFLAELERLCPFPIIQLQTDNDAAFTDKYRPHTDGLPTGQHAVDLWCAKHNIEHKLIPVGQKEINGKVENTHKQDDREFYSGVLCVNFESLRRSTEGYNLRWNETRRTKTLGRLTPSEVVKQAYVRVIAWILILQKQPENRSLVRLDSDGNSHLPINETKIKNKKKPKRKSLVDRYLQWQEWIDKQGIKSWLIVSHMSLISSLS